MKEDYKNNPIYQQGLKDGHEQAIADIAEIKALDEYLKSQNLCLCDSDGNVYLGANGRATPQKREYVADTNGDMIRVPLPN